MGSPTASIFAAGPGRDRRVALTFDDGPAASTEAVLDVLSAEDARATFFIVGGFVAGRESTLQRASAEGHELGVHGWNHFNAMHMREPEELLHELNACADELERALGERPQLVRRRTEATQAELRALRRSSGSVRSSSGPWSCFDWEEGAEADAIAARALAEAHPGAIICLHDGDGKDAAVTREATVAALPAIVQGLHRDGYELVTVSDLLG